MAERFGRAAEFAVPSAGIAPQVQDRRHDAARGVEVALRVLDGGDVAAMAVDEQQALSAALVQSQQRLGEERGQRRR
jgi:hypothetical protein